MAQFEALGTPKTDTLARPPLELVVCEVRHEPKPEVANPAVVLNIQAALGFGFEKLEPVNSAEFMMTATGPGQVFPQINQAQGWQLSTADGSWIATFRADTFALQCTQYTTWTDFRTILTKLIEVVRDTYHPQLRQRVGVRCVDRLWRMDSTIPKEWKGYLDPGALGLASNDLLADYIRVAQTTHEMAFGDYKATVRGSIASDQTPNKHSFLLDIDCFDERASIFDPANLEEIVGELHHLSLRLFQIVLTDKMYSELHG